MIKPITPTKLKKAVNEGIITQAQLDALMLFLEDSKETDFVEQIVSSEVNKKFSLLNFLYYFGGILIILSMGWFLGNAYDLFKESGALLISVFYITLFTIVGNYLWYKKLKTPAGLLYTASVSSVPLAVYCLIRLAGWIPAKELGTYNDFHVWIRGSFVSMELATILVGLIYLNFRKFPLLVLPIAYTAWYLSMDIVPFLLGSIREPSWNERQLVSLVFGLILLIVAFYQDRRHKEDYSKWLYLFGAVLLWSSTGSFLIKDSTPNTLYAFFNIFTMLCSILLERRIFLILGSLGLLTYLIQMSYVTFAGSIFFPLILISIGLVIIFSGVLYHKNQQKIGSFVENLVPFSMRKMLPKYRMKDDFND